jgi:hypothetical protein
MPSEFGLHHRRKGVRAEREVFDRFQAAGATDLRSLEGQGDTLVEFGGRRYHVETKRREQIRLMEWVRQSEQEAGLQTIPLTVFRQNGQPWRVCILLDDFLEVAGAPKLRPVPPTS